MAEEEQQHDWVGPRPLRQTTVVSFIPAFPLCLAHGILSRSPVPAVGLVPLAVSAASGIALLSGAGTRSHPSAIFAGDLVLAAALIVVLVFTWIAAPAG